MIGERGSMIFGLSTQSSTLFVASEDMPRLDVQLPVRMPATAQSLAASPAKCV